MRIAVFDDLINKKNAVDSPEPLQAEAAKDMNFSNCINCPGLCLKCIKHLFDTINVNFSENSCRLVYVLSGKIRLVFPNAQMEKQLDANGIMLISNETKVIIENEDDVLANFVVKCLDVVKAKISENIDPLNCSMGRMIST
ncbi:hypothetical protein [Sporomusa aerivorans]|uniref:hypothetical protein n=1 Tax=Sporomusa aerivorans TaxID=204936 RepID=UPI00352A10C4